MPTNIRELIGRELTEEEIVEMAEKCSNKGTETVGSFKVLHRGDMENIYRMAK